MGGGGWSEGKEREERWDGVKGEREGLRIGCIGTDNFNCYTYIFSFNLCHIQAINDKILSLDLQQVHAKIKQVDSHATLGNGIVIQVCACVYV